MVILFEEKLFLQDWLYKSCTAKVLMFLTSVISKSGENKIRLSRKEMCLQLNESDWSVRMAVKTLIEHKILLQLSSSSGAAAIYTISTDYIKIDNISLQLSSKGTRKKSKSSPASLQLSSSSESELNNYDTENYSDKGGVRSPASLQLSSKGTRKKSKSSPASLQLSSSSESELNNYDTENYSDKGGVRSPASLQLSSSLNEKETKKKNSPIPPIKKIKKKEVVLTDGSQLLPDGKVVLNKRAREVFEKIYQELYGTTYYWTAKDAGQMTKLLNAIKFSRQNRPLPLQNDTDSVINALEKFLLSINKTWINDNFSVAMIASHYNEIISELKNKKNNGKAMYRTDNSADCRRAEIVSNVASYDEKWKRENSTCDTNR